MPALNDKIQAIIENSSYAEGSPGGAGNTGETEQSYYRFLFENNPFPAWIVDAVTGQFLDVNRPAIEFYGYTKEEFLLLTLSAIQPGKTTSLAGDRTANKNLHSYISTHYKKSGESADVEIKGTTLLHGGKTIQLVLINDVTHNAQAETILKKINEQYRLANERYHIITHATHDLIWDWDIEANELHRDPTGLLEVYGLNSNDSIRQINSWLSHIHPEDLPKVQTMILNIVNAKDQNTFDIEYRFKKENGDYAYIYDRGYILRSKEGKAYRMIGAAQNITERKKLEQELLDQQKAISQAIITTQEKERTEIGKELHDNVNQVLTTTKLYLDLALTNPDLKEDLIKKSSKNISNAISEIRKLSESLMMPSLGDLGLIDSIDDLVENINATKKIDAIFLHDDVHETIFDENQKLTLFRIVQEALNNVVKHAEAEVTTIELFNEGDKIILVIKDDGKGFDALVPRKGAGLNNIRNRVYLLNGILTVDTQPGKGCTLVVELPHHH